MARFEPFETNPRVAVAVSGGRDSLALALLARDWVRARGGDLLALTVDHGIRAAAPEEAATVGRWLAHHRIGHRVLRHQGAVPVTRIQETARGIRYALLLDACRDERILHLLLGHQRDDQAETVAIRAARGSGPDGLAGMAALRETPRARLLRPLLGFPRTRTAATLVACGQPWIDDPSNADRRYDRARLRGDGGDLSGWLGGVRAAAIARAAAEAEVARLAAEHVWVGPEGHALIDMAGLRCLPPARQGRLLQAVLRMVGTGPYAPRRAALASLAAAAHVGEVRAMTARTLAGCRIVPWQGRLLVCREPSAVGPEVAVTGPGPVRWDDRFSVAIPTGLPAACRIAALGGRRPPLDVLAEVPGPVRETLPALWNGSVLLAVPTAGWYARADLPRLDTVFKPVLALAAGPFAVV